MLFDDALKEMRVGGTAILEKNTFFILNRSGKELVMQEFEDFISTVHSFTAKQILSNEWVITA